MADPVKGFLLPELRDYKRFSFNEGVKGFWGVSRDFQAYSILGVFKVVEEFSATFSRNYRVFTPG